MAVIAPLPAVRYDPVRAGDLRQVVAPPYDVISPAQQEDLHRRSPYNVVRLILPRETDRASAASGALRDWMASGVLVQDTTPALYPYTQQFTLPDGTTRTREGILCRLRLEDFASGVVRPHERTFPGPKADRLAILRATGAHLSPIFGLYARPGERLRDLLGGVFDRPPLVDVVMDGGDRHRLWRLTDAAAVARVTGALAGETILIADGHHRYETALAYRNERGGAGASAWVLAFLTNMEEEGLVVLPTHRLVRRALAIDTATLLARLEAGFAIAPLDHGPRPHGAIDLILPERRVRLRPRPTATACLGHLAPAVRALDVAVLHGAILEPVLGLASDDLDFTHDDAEAIRAVADGRAGAAFLVNPPGIDEVEAVCLAGELMPEKSTYFFPKLASGLVFDLVGPPWL